MKLARTTVVLALFGLITVGTGIGQDSKGGKAKGMLPQHFAKLGLSDEQKNKIYDIQSKYKAKIEDLEKQLKDMKEKKEKDEVAVLTDSQKAELKKILTGKLDK